MLNIQKIEKKKSIHLLGTENLYIEGDNLEVLKLLRNSYYGKVKMIYIDPKKELKILDLANEKVKINKQLALIYAEMKDKYLNASR